MPVATEPDSPESSEAVRKVLNSLDDPETAGLILEEQAHALKSILGDPTVLKLIKAHDKLEDGRNQVESQDTVQLCREVLSELEPRVAVDDAAAELSGLIQEPHFRALMASHDAVAFKTYESPPASPGYLESGPENGFAGGEAIRMVGLHKQAKEALGVTLKVEDNQLVIARILHGGMIDRQGLLHVGDIIKEVNGRDMSGNPDELQEYLTMPKEDDWELLSLCPEQAVMSLQELFTLPRECSGKVTLKILPSYHETPALCQVYVRAHFDYDPKNDKLNPCPEAGLSFKSGEVLQIVDQEDPDWWQATRVDGSKDAGLIPSQICEERRRASVRRPHSGSGFLCGSKRKQKVMYSTSKNADLDKYEFTVYEEVAKMPPFQRKTLVLIGAPGVGRRTLKNKLILSDQSRFGTTLPHTSRPPRTGEQSGRGYFFVNRDEMQRDVRNGRYLEHGEYEGNLYGTKVDTIREVMRSGKMCLLDVNPTALKVLKTPEFMPYVVFIASPTLETLRAHNKSLPLEENKKEDKDLVKTHEESERLFHNYSHYFDNVIVNDSLDEAFKKLRDSIESLSTEPQWVPVSWVY